MLTFDITNDFIVGDRITKRDAKQIRKLPHKIKAGFVSPLCRRFRAGFYQSSEVYD